MRCMCNSSSQHRNRYADRLVSSACIRQEIDGQDTTLLGFVGTPWTLAAYAMEGKADRDCKQTKVQSADLRMLCGPDCFAMQVEDAYYQCFCKRTLFTCLHMLACHAICGALHFLQSTLITHPEKPVYNMKSAAMAYHHGTCKLCMHFLVTAWEPVAHCELLQSLLLCRPSCTIGQTYCMHSWII